MAQSRLEQMVNLYTNGYARVARAKLEAGLTSNRADEITRIADVLSGYTFNYSDIKVAVEKDDESYFGRRCSDELVLLTVFEPNGLGVDSFGLKVNDFDNYYARALSQDSNYFRSLMSKIDSFNRDFHEQLPNPLYLNLEYKVSDHIMLEPVYDPIMLNELEERLCRYYKMEEIPTDVFEYDTSYYKKTLESYQFIQNNNNLIFNRKNYLGITPLMVAVSRVTKDLFTIPITLEKRLEFIRRVILRDRSIDINKQDIFGRTALMHVVLRLYLGSDRPGKEAVTKLLLEHGADPFVTDVLGKSAIDYFIEYSGRNHPASILLLEKSNPFALRVAKIY